MDAIGLYIDVSVPATVSYEKSDLIGGAGGDGFDDFLSNPDSEMPSKITNMIINYGSAINGVQVTYLLPSGASSTVLHGVLSRDNCSTMAFLTLMMTNGLLEWTFLRGQAMSLIISK